MSINWIVLNYLETVSIRIAVIFNLLFIKLLIDVDLFNDIKLANIFNDVSKMFNYLLTNYKIILRNYTFVHGQNIVHNNKSANIIFVSLYIVCKTFTRTLLNALEY